MATTNDITGDALVSKPATERFRDNYDLIFSGTKKKKKNASEKSKVLPEPQL